MTDRSKETLDCVRAVMALAERDIDLGLVTAEQIQDIPRTRFAPYERKQVAALLKAEGKSNREIGAELGVDHKTVAKDLRGENSPDGGENSPPKRREPKATDEVEHGQRVFNTPQEAHGTNVAELLRNAPDPVAEAFDIIMGMGCQQWQRLMALLDEHERLPVKGTEEGDAVLNAGRQQLKATGELRI